jgi:hypothetical protein
MVQPEFKFDTPFMIYRLLSFNSCLHVMMWFILFYLSDLIQPYFAAHPTTCAPPTTTAPGSQFVYCCYSDQGQSQGGWAVASGLTPVMLL